MLSRVFLVVSSVLLFFFRVFFFNILSSSFHTFVFLCEVDKKESGVGGGDMCSFLTWTRNKNAYVYKNKQTNKQTQHKPTNSSSGNNNNNTKAHTCTLRTWSHSRTKKKKDLTTKQRFIYCTHISRLRPNESRTRTQRTYLFCEKLKDASEFIEIQAWSKDWAAKATPSDGIDRKLGLKQTSATLQILIPTD